MLWSGFRSLRFTLGLFAAAAASVGSMIAGAGSAAGSAAAAEARPMPGAVELDDRPEPLVPKKAGTSADDYKQRSLSYYAAGIMYEEQGNRQEALRHFQKALRYDPEAIAILRQIIDVAWSLERHQEAIRYALKAAEIAPENPELLERLAAYLEQEDDLKQAVSLYEKAVQLKKGDEKTPAYVRLKMLIGRLYAKQENFKAAAEALAYVDKALQAADDYGLKGRAKKQMEGDKGQTYLLIGETMLRADRVDEAESAFERSHKISADDALYAYNRAQIAEKRKKFDDAIESLDEYFEAESDQAGVDPYELLKRSLKATGKSDTLIKKLAGLAKEDPKNVPLRYFLAREYKGAGDFAAAKPVYEELLRRAATVEAYEGLLDICLKTKDATRLVEVLAEVAGKTGTLDAVKKFVADLVTDKAKLDEVIAAARKLAEASKPDDGKPVALATGLVAVEAKRWDEAGEMFELALLHDPKIAPAIYLSWGLGLLGDDKHAEAVTVFRRAVDENVTPDNPAFHTYLAISLEFAGKTDDALKMAAKAAELGKGELRYESRIPWILYHAKRYSEAADAYRKLIAKFDADRKSEDERQLLREARLSLSNIYVHIGDVAKAEEPLEQILDEFPEDIGAMNDLGYLWADGNKNLELALGMIRKAVESDPKNRAYRDSLGWVYYRLRRFAEAVAELEKAATSEKGEDGPDGVILDHLGDAYQAAGRKEEAAKSWTRAVAAFEKAKETEKALATKKKLK
jgi:tetratricopeptide (TPR) repeat protein